MARGGGRVRITAAEVPVTELEVRCVAEKIPADDAAGIDEVNLAIRRGGDFVEIETGLGEAGFALALDPGGDARIEGRAQMPRSAWPKFRSIRVLASGL